MTSLRDRDNHTRRWSLQGTLCLSVAILLGLLGLFVYADPDSFGKLSVWRFSRKLDAAIPLGSKRQEVETWLSDQSIWFSSGKTGIHAAYGVWGPYFEVEICVDFRFDEEGGLKGRNFDYFAFCP